MIIQFRAGFTDYIIDTPDEQAITIINALSNMREVAPRGFDEPPRVVEKKKDPCICIIQGAVIIEET